MNYVIYGEEKLLMEQKLQSLKKQYHIQEEDMNLMTYWCLETPMSEIIEDASTPPFFSEYKMIILKDPIFFTTEKVKESFVQEASLLMEYLQQENPSTIMIIYHDKKNFDERKKNVKLLRKCTKFLTFDKLDYFQIYKATHQAIKSRGCEIDDDALNYFLSQVPNDLLEISQEVNKLCLYTKHIDKKTVEIMIPKRTEDKIYELSNAVLHKDVGKSISVYQDLQTMKDAPKPAQLISALGKSVRLLYQVKLLDRKGYNNQEIARMLTQKPARLNFIRADSQNFDFQELLEMLDALSQLDVQMKTGQIDGYKGFELFLIRLGG